MLRDIVEQARSEPNHPAAADLDRAISYAELIDEAGRLGAGLGARGVRAGDRIALFIPNSVDFLVAALGCLWIGAAFVPLAVTDPQSRLRTIVADCAPALVVTSDDRQQEALLENTPQVSMSDLYGERSVEMLEGDVGSRVAYMIYTSGTTGTPKGVQIDNAAFAAAVRSTADALGLSRDTRTLCVSPFHFDGSYANLFPTLTSGGTVVIRPRDALLFSRTFFNTVEKESINYSGFTPSYLRLLLASPQISKLGGSTLQTIALGGEAISAGDLRTLWSHAPNVRVFNRYGPTETTIAVTNVELTPAMIEHGTITIGRPHSGVTFALVDEDERVIEASNRVGELYIGGVQLMVGYWANSELTQKVMRTDLLPGETLYRTGDLVYRDNFGSYVYVDRSDRVIKRSGVRISLVELNASMIRVEGVVAAACVTFDRDGDLGIVAFVTTAGAPTALELRRAALQLIPENMMPDKIECVAAMPLNKSNQLDEHRLLAEAGLQPFHPSSSKPSPHN